MTPNLLICAIQLHQSIPIGEIGASNPIRFKRLYSFII